MSRPPGYAGHCKERCIQCSRNIKHLVYKAGIEVHVYAAGPGVLALCLECLGNKPLHGAVQGKLVVVALGSSQLGSLCLKEQGSWVRQGVDGMAIAIYDAGPVKGFLPQYLPQVVYQLPFVLPVLDILHNVLHHPLHLLVGTAVERAFHGAEGCGNGGVGVGLGRCDHMVCESGVVTAAVLCVENKRNVKDRCLQLGVLGVGADHTQEVCRSPDLGGRSVEEKALAVVVVGLCLVAVGYHGGEPGYKLDALAKHIVYGNIVGIGVVGVAYQHAPGQFVHDIPAGSFEYHVLGKTGRQLSAFVQGGIELLKLFCSRQLPKNKEESSLLKAMPVFLYGIGDQVVDQDTPVGKSAFVRYQDSFIKDVTMGIAYLRKPDHHSGAVFVPKATFGVVL